MKAIILAAGRGSRMKRLTEASPKCLAPLAGQTLLHWQLDALKTAGVKETLLIRGYQAEKLRGKFHTIDNPDWSTSNMVVTLACASEWLEQEPCIISYSDIVYHPSHVKALSQARADITITYDRDWLELWSLRFEDPLDDAETFREQGGFLTEIGGKTRCLSDIAGQYMGLLRTTPKGWRAISDDLKKLSTEKCNKLDMTGLLRSLLSKKVPIETIAVRGKWCEADSEDDLELYEKALNQSEKQKKTWSHDWRVKST